jgi:hypothetical protein
MSKENLKLKEVKLKDIEPDDESGEITAVPEKSYVTRSIKVGKEKVAEDMNVERDESLKRIAGRPAIVKVSMGKTINTGNYSSVRIDVGAEFPSSASQVDTVYDLASSFCHEKLAKEEAYVMNMGKGEGGEKAVDDGADFYNDDEDITGEDIGF